MKCTHCKKLTHIEYTCGCGKKVCLACRLPETHGCKTKENQTIQLVKIVAPKLVRIQDNP
jgi:hypothetical protein